MSTLFVCLYLPEGAADAGSLFKGKKEEQSRHPDLNFPLIPRVILAIPHPVHTFNPESRPHIALKIPNSAPIVRLNPESRPHNDLKVPNPGLQMR